MVEGVFVKNEKRVLAYDRVKWVWLLDFLFREVTDAVADLLICLDITFDWLCVSQKVHHVEKLEALSLMQQAALQIHKCNEIAQRYEAKMAI